MQFDKAMAGRETAKRETADLEAQPAAERDAETAESPAVPAVESTAQPAAELAVESTAQPAAEPAVEPAAGSSDGSKQGRKISHSDMFKFAGLLAFIATIAVIVVLAWPYIADVFTEGGPERLVARVRDAGPAGVFVLLGMQFLQIVVAFIPGEVVQLAAGLMYGPWFGALVILVGCVISSAVVYLLVHKLGAPFVQGMVSMEHLGKFRAFEESGKLDIVVFILFLIPAMPKDVFTYLVPLTDMEMKRFLLLSNVGRVPGILASTYAAHGLAEGEIIGPVVIVAIVVVLALLGIVFRNRIMEALSKR